MRLKFRILRHFVNNKLVAAYYFKRARRMMRSRGLDSLCKRLYMVDKANRAVYVEISKAANSSIKQSMFQAEIPDDYSMHMMTEVNGVRHVTQLTEEERGYYVFSFVRNPYSRLVSAYESKMHVDVEKFGRRWFDSYLFGFLTVDRGFEDFARKVCSIPEELLDQHVYPQYNLLYSKDGKCFADFVGKMESLSADYEPIRSRFGYAPLRHYNKSLAAMGKDWRDYYSKELADMVYEKYRKDFEAFGYEKL